MSKKKTMKMKAEMLDNVIIFLQGICGADLMFLQTNNPQKDICLRFNVHGIIGFVTKYLVDKKLGLPHLKQNEFLEKWEVHVKEVLTPLYQTEVDKMINPITEEPEGNDFYS